MTVWYYVDMDKTDITMIIAISVYLIVVGCLMFEIGSNTDTLFSGIDRVFNTLDWLGRYLAGR